MKRGHFTNGIRIFSTLAAILIGTTRATSCTTEQISAVLAGVQVVADQLSQDDDITFSDWLASELRDQ